MKNRVITIREREVNKLSRLFPEVITRNVKRISPVETENSLPAVLFITSFPPRQCGIATYSQDLIKSLHRKFKNSFTIKVCALETEHEKFNYSNEVHYTFDTSRENSYQEMANTINLDKSIQLIVIQHEFGFFNQHDSEFTNFLRSLEKPIIIGFHTVIPLPNMALKSLVQTMMDIATSIIVMTKSAASILKSDYQAISSKLCVIPHGTHLVPFVNKEVLKEEHGFKGRKVLSTFGLLSSGKNIETTLSALPGIVEKNPEVLFLIIGKTHPGVVKNEGEAYREMLETKVQELSLDGHVLFINEYLTLPRLLAYLELTDIYLFTSNDPNQAVSGTFSYAVSCGCPIISTPIPHARELLNDETGILVEFGNSSQLSDAVNYLLSNDDLRLQMSLNGLHKMAPTAWENTSIMHAQLFKKSVADINLHYRIPPINFTHVKAMTTDFAMIQFSKLNQPDIESGYTLDDNARALVAICHHYQLTKNSADLSYIILYFDFIKFCFQSEGYFLNYVDKNKKFTDQNNTTNLADSNGRAIWAIGYLISLSEILPEQLIVEADEIMQSCLTRITTIHSTRAMAFTIKGLCYYNTEVKSAKIVSIITLLTDRLVQMFKHESEKDWKWFESYLTYANSILPESLLCAYSATGNELYKEIAVSSFEFLMEHTFVDDYIKVISNQSWMYKGEKKINYGEQPIDVAYTVLALSRFYEVLGESKYLQKMGHAFDWFLGKNHLNRIIYNPCTGGCFDGLEENYINLNQGAESTISYLLARLTIEKNFTNIQHQIISNRSIETKKEFAQSIAI